VDAGLQERPLWDNQAAKQGESLKYLQYQSSQELHFAEGIFK